MKDYLTISASSFSTFFKCSKQYNWQFIEEREPDEASASIFTIFGTTFHKAMELHFKFGLDLLEIRNAWKTLLVSQCSEEKSLEFPSKQVLEENIIKGYNQIDNIIKMKTRWDTFKILEIEKYFRVVYKNPYLENVFLSGRIDLLLNDDDSVVCLDWKTSKTKEEKIDENIQLTFYTFFVNDTYKYQLETIYGALAYPADGTILFTKRINEDFLNLFKKINIMLNRISKKDFFKEPKIEMRLGDCFFCQYKKTCNKN